MQRRSTLREPFRNIIKSIGFTESHSHTDVARHHRHAQLQPSARNYSIKSPETYRSDTGEDAIIPVQPPFADIARSPRVGTNREPYSCWHAPPSAPLTHRIPRTFRKYSTTTAERAAERNVLGLVFQSPRSIDGVEDEDSSVYQRTGTSGSWSVSNRKLETSSPEPSHSPQNERSPTLHDQDITSPQAIDPEDSILPSSLRRGYHQSAQGALRHRKWKQIRRIQLQRSRYPSRMTDQWSLIIRLLEKASVQGKKHYAKRKESLRFPEGVHANFIGAASDVFLEIMLRTGSHVQIMPGTAISAERGFHSLIFYGTPVENTEALKILPDFVATSTNAEASRTLPTYTLQKCDSDDDRQPESSGGNTASRSSVRPSSSDERDTRQNNIDDVDEDLSAQDLVDLGESLNRITFSKTRSVWAHDRSMRKISVGPPKRPEQWTPASLYSYIDDLTRTPPATPPKLGSRPNPQDQASVSHVEQTVAELEALFSERGLGPVITSVVVNHALRFLVKHGKVNEARRVLANLEQSGFRLSASNFVVLLNAAANNGDEFNFRNTLQAMVGHGIPITAAVWVQVHRLAYLTSPQRAKQIATAMRKKGILADRSAALSVLQTSVADKLTIHLTKGKSLKTFLRFYDRTRAPSLGLTDGKWLTINTLNPMLQACLLSGRMEDASDLLEEYRARHKHHTTSTATLNTFLSASLRNRDPKSAVSALTHFTSDKSTAIQPDQTTFSLLFRLAWAQRYFNMCRVVWRYACTHGHAATPLQHLVFKSLLAFPPPASPTPSRAQLWQAWAGKFVLDLSDGVHYAPPLRAASTPIALYLDRIDRLVSEERRFTTPASAALESELVNLSDASSYPPNSPRDASRRARLRLLLEEDVDAARNLRPVVPLPDMLARAFERDLEWKRRGLGSPKSLLAREGGAGREGQVGMFEEMMTGGVRVPVRVGNAVLIRTSRAMR